MKDQLEGETDKAIGGAKKTIGEATGDEKLQAEGVAQQVVGGAEKFLGDAKDRLNGAVQDVKDHLDKK
jgi:uncharacterized protein YjbJ (UPF0337 family)